MEEETIIRLHRANIDGSEILDILRHGHIVRRSCWRLGVFLRICNEDGFDYAGHAVLGEYAPIYTHTNRGYFHHLCSSREVMQNGKNTREGMEELWASDWEDWGFVTSEGFRELTQRFRRNEDATQL